MAGTLVRYSTSSMLCTSRFLPAVGSRPVARSLPSRTDEVNVHVISRMRYSISFPFQDHNGRSEGVEENSRDGVEMEGVACYAGRRNLSRWKYIINRHEYLA